MGRRAKDIAIVGAGPAGLAAAWALSQAGLRPVVFEKLDRPGGLCRSYRFGEFVFDLGPHRFHTYRDRAREFLLSVGSDWYVEVPRVSGVYMWGKYFLWPLRGSAVLRMPPGVVVRVLWEMIRGLPEARDESFESYIVSRYGPTLYRIFFRPYTEKFLKLDGREVHQAWATGSIQKAIIDKREQTSIWQLAKSALLPAQRPLTLWYPKRPGVQSFFDMLCELLEQDGVEVRLSAPVERIERRDGRWVLEAGGEAAEFDLVVWTGPLEPLARLSESAPRLEYLSTVFYFVAVDAPPVQPWQWCYFGAERPVFVRLSCPRLFNEACAPEGHTGICAEITALGTQDEAWREPERFNEEIVEGLRETRYIPKGAGAEVVGIAKVDHTYPVYRLGELEAVREWLEGLERENQGLVLLGRQARFWYNNADESMDQALEWAEKWLAERGLA